MVCHNLRQCGGSSLGVGGKWNVKRTNNETRSVTIKKKKKHPSAVVCNSNPSTEVEGTEDPQVSLASQPTLFCEPQVLRKSLATQIKMDGT